MDLIVDKEKCLRCGACVGVCPSNALKLSETGIEWNKELCKFCKLCKQTCPMGAIDFK